MIAGKKVCIELSFEDAIIVNIEGADKDYMMVSGVLELSRKDLLALKRAGYDPDKVEFDGWLFFDEGLKIVKNICHVCDIIPDEHYAKLVEKARK